MAGAAINKADHAAAVHDQGGGMRNVESIRAQAVVEPIALYHLAVFVEQKRKRHGVLREIFFRLEKSSALFRCDVEQVASGADDLIFE